MAREAMEYTRHQPEKTILYQVVEEYYPKFINHLEESDKTLLKWSNITGHFYRLKYQPIGVLKNESNKETILQFGV